MKDWDYAALTHTANIHGGPEKYINLIKSHASQKAISATNKKWAKGAIPALFILMPLAIKGLIDIGRETKERLNRDKISEQEAQEAEKELLKNCHEEQ